MKKYIRNLVTDDLKKEHVIVSYEVDYNVPRVAIGITTILATIKYQGVRSIFRNTMKNTAWYELFGNEINRIRTDHSIIWFSEDDAERYYASLVQYAPKYSCMVYYDSVQALLDEVSDYPEILSYVKSMLNMHSRTSISGAKKLTRKRR